MQSADIKKQLYELAGQMVRLKGMPSNFKEDWHFPKSISRKQRILIMREVDQACNQCKEWAMALKDCINKM